MFAPPANPLAPTKPTANPVPAVQPQPVLAPPAVPPKPIKRSPVHPTLTPPAGPPDKTLTQLSGVPTSVADFNQRLEAVTAAHVAQTGVKPPPDVALHAALSPQQVDPASVASYIVGRANPQAAAALAAHPAQTDEQFLNQLTGLAHAGNTVAYDQFVHDNESRIQELQRGPLAAKVNGAITAGAAANISYQGYSHLGVLGLAAEQIVGSLIHSPGGIAVAAKALGTDLVTTFTHPLNPSHKFSDKVIVPAAKQTAQDVQHPGRNPGYLFLDALGLASGGSGAAARVGAAGRAVSEAGDVGIIGKTAAAARAVVEKPALQRVTVRVGDYTEEMPLSSNPLVALVQKKIVGVRQGATDRLLDTGVPSPLRAGLLPQSAQDWFDENLSFVKKVGREADARSRVEHTANMALANQLLHAAGATYTQASIFNRLPSRALRGLSRGEQKAIQVLSWDDPNPLEAERAFHQAMIDQGVGDPKAHERQIADLKLAERALKNPSPRFQASLDLTREVIAEQQRLRIEELGLAPETAEGRIAKAAQVLRQEPAIGGERVSDESFYLPTQPRGKTKRPPSQARGFQPSAGPYGIPPGRDLPELNHEFTGDALRAGAIRIDATNLAAEAYARTVRAVTVKNQWQKHWDAASPTQRTKWDIPIRDANTIPDKLREVIAKLDEGVFTQAEADLLPQDMQDIIRALYPDSRDLTPDEIPHVKWVDGRLVTPRIESLNTGLAKAASVVNTPFRFTALYLRPAYLLNLLGNHAMLMFDQGFLNSGVNMARALRLEATDGARNAATIRGLVGAGKSKSYVTGFTGRGTRTVADFWNRIADRDERVASFIYYADRLGYKTPEARNALLTDPAHRADLVEATRRGNKALVEFDNLLPVEKNVLRHLIFVYPWVRGSAVWSLRAVLEHPMKTDILSHLGREEMTDDPLLKNAPAWFKRIGYFPVGWTHSGLPKVVNPTSVNTFSTLGDLLNVGKAGAEGDPYASFSDLLGPAATFGIHAATGRDQYGNKYPGSQVLGAMKELLNGLPQLAPSNRKGSKPVKPFDVRDRASLEAHINSLLHQTVFGPGWLDGYGSLIAGGFSPKSVNTGALEARGLKDLPPAQRIQWEKKLLDLALKAQGEFLSGQGSRPPMTNLPGKTPGMLKPGNIDLANRPVAHNPDGTISTVRSITVTDDQGHAYLIPTVIGGKVVSDADAVAYWKKTGQNLGVFASEKAADAYSIRLHDEQAKLYLTPAVPTGVRQAVNAGFEVTKAAAAFSKANGRTPTAKERAGLWLTYLTTTGAVPPTDSKKLAGQLNGLSDTDISAFQTRLVDKYGHGKELRQWDDDVRALYGFKKDTFDEKAAALNAQGLADQRTYANRSQADLYAYGRGYIKWRQHIRDLHKEKASPSELRVATDDASKSTNGLPSYAALMWSEATPQEQAHMLLVDSSAGWDKLTAFTKGLLGKKVDPGVTDAWHALDALSTQEKARMPAGQRTIAPNQTIALVKYIDREYKLGGKFLSDYEFSKQPLYQRLKYLNVVKDSPEQSQWHDLLHRADYFYQAIKNKQTSATAATDTWKDYAKALEAHYREDDPAFWKELGPILKANPHFLEGLIH